MAPDPPASAATGAPRRQAHSRATPRLQRIPGRPQLPLTRLRYLAIRLPKYRSPDRQDIPPYFSGYAPAISPPSSPPLIRSPTPGAAAALALRPYRREVIAPIATPWEVLGIRPPERVVRESARVAASRPQLIFVADQRRHPVADRRGARALKKLLSAKQRKKTLFW